MVSKGMLREELARQIARIDRLERQVADLHARIRAGTASADPLPGAAAHVSEDDRSRLARLVYESLRRTSGLGVDWEHCTAKDVYLGVVDALLAQIGDGPHLADLRAWLERRLPFYRESVAAAGATFHDGWYVGNVHQIEDVLRWIGEHAAVTDPES